MLPIIGPIFTAISTFFTWQKEKAVMRHKRDIAAIEANVKALDNAQTSLSYWETAQLKDKDKFLRRFSFLLMTTPVVYAIIDPDAVKYYFDVALASMPEWYLKLYVGVVGAVWGIHASRDAILGLISVLFNKNSKNPEK